MVLREGWSGLFELFFVIPPIENHRLRNNKKSE